MKRTTEEQVATLTATVDGLQTEVDRQHSLILLLSVTVTSLALIVAYLTRTR